MVVFCRYNTEHSSNKKSAILPQDRNKTYSFHFKIYPIYYIIHMSVSQKTHGRLFCKHYRSKNLVFKEVCNRQNSQKF